MVDFIVDGEILAVAAQIGVAIPVDAPFEVIMSALELVLARHILEAITPEGHPFGKPMAVQLVARHLAAMLEHPGVINGS